MPEPSALLLAAEPQRPSVPVELVAADRWAERRAALAARDAAWADVHGFSAKRGSVLILGDRAGALSRILLGLGDGQAGEPDIWNIAALAERVPAGVYRLAEPLDARAGQHAALGWALAQYRVDRYVKDSSAERRALVLPASVERAAAVAAAESLFLVRDLVNTPAADMGPAELAQIAHSLAERHGATVDEVVDEELLEQGFPTIHAVGRASDRRPRLIDLRWGRADAPKLTLVGKGVVFDSGGLDLKAASYMRWMKKDMGGAAHALGLAHWIMATGLDVRLRVLIPAVENAVSGNAFRPGDVIRTRAGITVEVGNTDAEGRLVLADALSLAGEEGPDLLLDFATLTGAARVALGPDVPAFFTDDHKLAADLATHAAREGDPLWRLPLYAPYEEDLASTVADLANVSDNGMAGAVIAGLFLKRFVADPGAWGHFDLFAWNSRPRPGRPKGGEAMALRAVYSYLVERYS